MILLSSGIHNQNHLNKSMENIYAKEIFIELIKLNLFDEKTLVSLAPITTQLNAFVMKHFTTMLRERHEECVKLGDVETKLNTFCLHYMRFIHYGGGFDLRYKVCSDCKLFGPISYDLCASNCILVCCGKRTVIPFYTSRDFPLVCGCVMTHKLNQSTCACGDNIASNIVPCDKCKRIPFRLRRYEITGISEG